MPVLQQSVDLAQDLHYTEDREADERDQGAFGDAQAEEGPGHFCALGGAAEDLAQHIPEGQGFEHVVQRQNA